MPMLFKRLAQVCVTASLAMPAAPVAATEGIASLFSATQIVSTQGSMHSTASLFSVEAEPYGSISEPDDMPRARPLLYASTIPVTLEPGPDAQYLTPASMPYTNADLDCLAEALYFEARGEGRQGQSAVAEVILNRVESKKFPDSVCAVVNQPRQFSYTIGGRKTIRNQTAHARAVTIAQKALDGMPRALTNGATYFHTTSVRPKWASRFFRTAKIGRHIFYSPKQRVAAN